MREALRPDIAATIDAIGPLDAPAMAAASARQEPLTKPAGSLGRLEALAIRSRGSPARSSPLLARKAVVVMAGDHGVTAEGVSAYPAEVTPQMVASTFCAAARPSMRWQASSAHVSSSSTSVSRATLAHPRLLSRRVAAGTANMARGRR